MTINNYTELLAAIANFLNRDDLGEVSKTFVQFAEADIQRQIRNWRQEKRAEANWTLNTPHCLQTTIRLSK